MWDVAPYEALYHVFGDFYIDTNICIYFGVSNTCIIDLVKNSSILQVFFYVIVYPCTLFYTYIYIYINICMWDVDSIRCTIIMSLETSI
jgi:hypothetical protein